MHCPNDGCPDFVASGVRGEYRDGVLICPKCQTPLVAGTLDTAPDVGSQEADGLGSSVTSVRRSRIVRFLCSLGSSEDGPSPLRLGGRTLIVGVISATVALLAMYVAGSLAGPMAGAPRPAFGELLAGLAATALIAPLYTVLFSVAVFPSAVLAFGLLHPRRPRALATVWGVVYGVSLVLMAMLVEANGLVRGLVIYSRWWAPFAAALGEFVLDLPVAYLVVRVSNRSAA